MPDARSTSILSWMIDPFMNNQLMSCVTTCGFLLRSKSGLRSATWQPTLTSLTDAMGAMIHDDDSTDLDWMPSRMQKELVVEKGEDEERYGLTH